MPVPERRAIALEPVDEGRDAPEAALRLRSAPLRGWKVFHASFVTYQRNVN
ncbi:MAG: hypothetical protein HN392_12790 [Anaerolineae bacterium]|nr:hypothetical protein [Anaerolineae bacterium]MBT7783044.1 hypothetical protein [Anaerolineae bacterium]